MHYACIDADNDAVPNRRHANIWTDDALGYRNIYMRHSSPNYGNNVSEYMYIFDIYFMNMVQCIL